jgi:G3E family GTPase
MAEVIPFHHRRSSTAAVSLFLGLPQSGVELLFDRVRRLGVPLEQIADPSSRLPEDDCAHCQYPELINPLLSTVDPKHPVGVVLQPEADPAVIAEWFFEGLITRPLHSMITVIHAARFRSDYGSELTLGERFEFETQLSERAKDDTVVDLLIEGIEFCDRIVLSHCSNTSERELVEIETLIAQLQPRAKILRLDGERPCSDAELLEIFSPVFQYPKTIESCAWKQAIHAPNEFRFVYRKRRPFHPQRLYRLIELWPDRILRTMGQVWLASHPERAYTLNQAGLAPMNFVSEGPWLASLPESERKAAWEHHPELKKAWNPWTGDRMNEIAFVCEPGPLASIFQKGWMHALDACLVRDDEIHLPPTDFVDPFPKATHSGELDEEAGIAEDSKVLRLLKPEDLDTTPNA